MISGKIEVKVALVTRRKEYAGTFVVTAETLGLRREFLLRVTDPHESSFRLVVEKEGKVFLAIGEMAEADYNALRPEQQLLFHLLIPNLVSAIESMENQIPEGALGLPSFILRETGIGFSMNGTVEKPFQIENEITLRALCA